MRPGRVVALVLGILGVSVTQAQPSATRCNSPTVPLSWAVEEPRRQEYGDAPVLVRRQPAPRADGRLGEKQIIILPIEAGEDPVPIYGDPSSPYLYLTVVPRRGRPERLRLLVLCKAADQPRTIADRTFPERLGEALGFEVFVSTQVVAELPGEAMAFVVGDGKTLLWRNRTGAVELLDWGEPVRALALRMEDRLHLTALLESGRLLERTSLPEAPMPPRAEPLTGWDPGMGRSLLRGWDRVWLRDTEHTLLALAQSSGLAFGRRTGRTRRLYGDNGEKLVAWDKFFSRRGDRTGLFLLLAEQRGNGAWAYSGRILDLADRALEPTARFPIEGLLDTEQMAMPVVVLQAWDQNFEHMTGFVFHNPDRRGTMDAIEITRLWDADAWRMRPELLVHADNRQQLRDEILPLQVSVRKERRREKVFFITEREGFEQRFDDPLAAMAGGRP